MAACYGLPFACLAAVFSLSFCIPDRPTNGLVPCPCLLSIFLSKKSKEDVELSSQAFLFLLHLLLCMCNQRPMGFIFCLFLWPNLVKTIGHEKNKRRKMQSRMNAFTDAQKKKGNEKLSAKEMCLLRFLHSYYHALQLPHPSHHANSILVTNQKCPLASCPPSKPK